jgi:hypothetical protein
VEKIRKRIMEDVNRFPIFAQDEIELGLIL